MNLIQLKTLQALPLTVKIMKSKQRIEEFIRYFGRDKVYLSFSAGKDSTVLAHLIHQVDPTIPLVFSDTGLEFPEIRTFAFAQNKIVVVKPAINHVETIIKYGYPVASKLISRNIYKLRHQNLTPEYRNYLLNGDKRGKMGMIPKQWQFLEHADFEVGAGCCEVMKKQVFHRYEKEYGKEAFFTGELAEEGQDRKKQYLKFGCNAFNRKAGAKSMPLGFWTENDILEYIRLYRLPIASVYGDVVAVGLKMVNNNITTLFETTGYDRTGCVFCAYGCHRETKEENRFLRLQNTHPEMYDYCMRGGKYNDKGIWIPDKGLGMAHVLNTIGVECGYSCTSCSGSCNKKAQ